MYITVQSPRLRTLMCKQQWQTMENHLVLLKKTLFFFERFALLVALLIPEAKDLALLCVLIANLVYFTVCCITMDDHVASLFPFVVSTCML